MHHAKILARQKPSLFMLEGKSLSPPGGLQGCFIPKTKAPPNQSLCWPPATGSNGEGPRHDCRHGPDSLAERAWAEGVW